jgi:hypothetical protein
MTQQNIEIESQIIQKFVRKDKRDRYLAFISKQKTRYKFVSELAHFNDFEPNRFDKVSGDKRQVIQTRIKTIKNQSDCYAISENREIDGQRIDIKTALEKTIGYGMGTILVFGDIDIVYFEGEGPNDRLISRK